MYLNDFKYNFIFFFYFSSTTRLFKHEMFLWLFHKRFRLAQWRCQYTIMNYIFIFLFFYFPRNLCGKKHVRFWLLFILFDLLILFRLFDSFDDVFFFLFVDSWKVIFFRNSMTFICNIFLFLLFQKYIRLAFLSVFLWIFFVV